MRNLQRQIALVSLLVAGAMAAAQSLPGVNNMTPSITLVPTPVIAGFAPANPVTPPCAKPAEAFDIDDYNGPLNHVVERFSQRIENTTVHIPRRHGIQPCSLSVGDKFHMFVESTSDPLNYLGAAWDAATAQWDRDDPSYQMGASGFGKRYGAATLDNVTGDFFNVFLYPSIFKQDPRYYSLGQGSARVRLTHALAHSFITRGDSGNRMLNYSEWFGTVSSKALNNLYHPGNPRGFGPTASRVGMSVANDMAWDVVREFWPEIAHRCHLPFRTHTDPLSVNAPARRAPVRVDVITEITPALDPVQ